MATHADLTGTHLHDPKGFSAAGNDTKLTKDSLGALVWADNNAVPSGSSRYGEMVTADGAGSSGYGQKVWKDLLGQVVTRRTAGTRPAFGTFMGVALDAFHFSATDAVNFYFHIPHDYAIGTDIFLHTHWGHNGTAISGNMIWTAEVTISNRTAAVPHGSFKTPITTSMNSNTISGAMNITNYPQHCHCVEEIQLSSATPSASQLNTADLLIDGVVHMNFAATAIPIITGSATNEPFLFFVDIHYQADMEGTLNKDPDYYA